MMGIFLEEHGEPFTAFGSSHLIALFIYFAGITIFLLFAKKILYNRSVYNTIRWSLFSLLVLSEVSYQTYTALNGIWSLADHIFLHLCGIAGITGAIALINHNKLLIQITFFIGLVPAFLALVTPELPYDFPHYRYLKFFVHHTAISWTSIFLVVSNNVTITFKTLLKTYGYVLIYAAIIGFFVNPLLGSNYLYLSHTPTANTPLDLLGSGIWYYVNLCILAFVVFFVQYKLYRLFTRKKFEQ
ncbi:TIGR02206 family membrane protein [Lentibacillus sp. CBA3610]|uniref:YwaF family protein n=1 Tax=Lentibacillus sp. CBA3610 TaxID=2518176 RepID=UPI0015954C83|nr:TIGR02206 family membrane protein [Lentibacillus sp. CBA3610]QKY71003.1 TIGR02206 family membrane protein [Lentibacillus sp. CBA3610]